VIRVFTEASARPFHLMIPQANDKAHRATVPSVAVALALNLFLQGYLYE
jgi:hypothetical protein